MTVHINTVAAVIVCYHPHPETLAQLIANLQTDVQHIWLVNNGPQLIMGPWSKAVRQIQCKGNIGVAGALNAGFDQAFAQGADAVIGFDQDSAPPAGMVESLRRSWNANQRQQPYRPMAAIGPATQDIDTGKMLHTFAPYNWQRQRLLPVNGTCIEVDHLITSGCLISRDAWGQIGPTNESFFIDWVDVEWCGRARYAGYQLCMDTKTVLPHRIGSSSQAIAGRRFHVHSPFRHYFVLRNAIHLFRDPRFVLGWRTHHLLYALRVILANLIVAPNRLQRFRYAAQALRDGWTGRTGSQGQVPD